MQNLRSDDPFSVLARRAKAQADAINESLSPTGSQYGQVMGKQKQQLAFLARPVGFSKSSGEPVTERAGAWVTTISETVPVPSDVTVAAVITNLMAACGGNYDLRLNIGGNTSPERYEMKNFGETTSYSHAATVAVTGGSTLEIKAELRAKRATADGPLEAYLSLQILNGLITFSI